MSSIMLADARGRPDLFLWNGPIDQAVLEQWLSRNGISVPRDLLQVWSQTGGGELFESETLLAPLPWAASEDGLVGTNARAMAGGMGSEYLIFHTGMRVSAVRVFDLTYIVFGVDSFDVDLVFDAFDEWYVGLLRCEYAGRYGLADK